MSTKSFDSHSLREEFFQTLDSRSKTEDKASYEGAKPFLYFVLDDIFPTALVEAAVTQYPDKTDPVWRENGTLYEIEGIAKKFCLTDSSKFPDPLQLMVELINSNKFIKYIETVTGIPELIADPALFGGGLNMVDQGGMLEVHADYNFNNDLQAYRCVNALIYLSDNWKAEYGGALELWDTELEGPPKIVLPEPGRVLIFATNDQTFHGYGPVNEPAGRTRNSINIYYHGKQPAPYMSAQPHKTIWKDVGRFGSEQ